MRNWEWARLAVSQINDGLSKTFFFGEKFVHLEHQGIHGWGDSTLWGAESPSPAIRVAGPKFPFSTSDTDPTVRQGLNMNFGGAHRSGVCQFVFGDGSVQALPPSIDAVVLGHLANRDDGVASPNDLR